MTNEQKNLITKIVVGLVIFLIALFLIEVLGQFLSYFVVKAVIAVVITWSVLGIGGQLGLPGFKKEKTKVKKKK